MTVCSRCGREGSRGFVAVENGWACTSFKACDERVERERVAHGLHRIDYVGKNGPSHYYKLDGKRVPGVTTIIKDALPAPALVDWAARVTARYAAENLDTLWGMRHMGIEAIEGQVLEHEPRTQRDSAGVRGTRLHEWAEQMLRGQEAEGITNELLPWVLAVRDFLEDFRPTPVLFEAALASHRFGGYAGTLDLVGDFPEVVVGGRPFPAARRIVDYKSSKRIYSEIALQLGAYRNAEVYLDEQGVERALADLGISEWGLGVLIRPEGYQVRPVYVGEEVLAAFGRVKWMREFIKRDGQLDQWLGDPLPPVTKGNA